MIERAFFHLLPILLLLQAPGYRPPPRGGHQGPPMFLAFCRGTSDAARFERALAEWPGNVRDEIRRRLAGCPKSAPVVELDSRIREAEREVAQSRAELARAMVGVLGDRSLEPEAIRFARSAVLWYEWEGYADGPLAEAAFAESYLREQPGTKLRPYLQLFLLYRYRCAFEAAMWCDGPPARRGVGAQDEETCRRNRSHAASRYRELWTKTRAESDSVVGALADDIDAEAFLYIGDTGHPRR